MTRRMFEPMSRFDRVLYILVALTGPSTVIAAWGNPDLRWASFIMAVWSAIAIFYTIDWTIRSYRSWRSSSGARSLSSRVEVKQCDQVRK